MTNPDIQKKAINLIISINAAITNVRLYPPTSALIINSVNRMYQSVTEILNDTESIEYAESEKSLLIQGEPLPEKEQKKPQVTSFLRVMIDLELRSICIKNGISKNEVAGFIQVLGMSAENLNDAGGIKQVLQDKQITHVTVDEQIYVKLDAERSIVAEMNISDKDIISYLLEDQEISEHEREQIRSLLKDPDVAGRIFQEGVQRVMAGPKGGDPVSTSLVTLITAFRDLSEESREAHSKEILHTLTDMDENILLAILTHDIDNVFGESLFTEFLEELEENRFKKLMHKINQVQETVLSGKNTYSSSQATAIDQVLKIMQNVSETKNQMKQPGKSSETVSGAAPAEPHEERIEKLKVALSSVLKGDTSILAELTDVDGLAAVIHQFSEKGKNHTVASIIENLGTGAVDENKKIRDVAAELLSKIDDRLDETKHFEEKIAISRKLSEWLTHESEISPIFGKIATQLQQNAKQMIRNEKYEEASDILETYHRMYTGDLKRDDAITALSENMLQNISTEDILDILLKDGATDQITQQKKDLYSLVIMGTTTAERLLDRLHDSHNRSERIRVVQVITKIGEPALDLIQERLQQGGPWFYVRNLVLLLGRIGNESHLKRLEPILAHEDLRVQREAAFAIMTIDPENAGHILLQNMYTVNTANLGFMISVLGQLRYHDAVPVLIELLESTPSGSGKKEKNAIMIKTCEALGKIGNSSAIRPLKNIARSKGFLFINAIDPEVRTAAKEALKAIEERVNSAFE